MNPLRLFFYGIVSIANCGIKLHKTQDNLLTDNLLILLCFLGFIFNDRGQASLTPINHKKARIEKKLCLVEY